MDAATTKTMDAVGLLFFSYFAAAAVGATALVVLEDAVITADAVPSSGF